MLAPQATSQLKVCALNLRAISHAFGSSPLAPAALLIAKCVMLLTISYVVWSDLKWF